MRAPLTPKLWKQVAEVRNITFDFGSKLAEGDMLSGGEVVGADTGVTAGAPSRVENKVTVQMSGGTVDTTYRISCRANTTGGETLELDVDLEVLDGAN